MDMLVKLYDLPDSRSLREELAKAGVSLRRALRQANRKAFQRLKEHHSKISLHLACAVVVNNEIYGSRVGAAQVFLVRRARLFLPGDEPGELADFVHRTTTRSSLRLVSSIAASASRTRWPRSRRGTPYSSAKNARFSSPVSVG